MYATVPGNRKCGKSFVWSQVPSLKLFLKLSRIDPKRYPESKMARAMTIRLNEFLISLEARMRLVTTLPRTPRGKIVRSTDSTTA